MKNSGKTIYFPSDDYKNTFSIVIVNFLEADRKIPRWRVKFS